MSLSDQKIHRLVGFLQQQKITQLKIIKFARSIIFEFKQFFFND